MKPFDAADFVIPPLSGDAKIDAVFFDCGCCWSDEQGMVSACDQHSGLDVQADDLSNH